MDRIQSQKLLTKLEYKIPECNSELFRCLHDYSTELILFMMAATNKTKVKKAISLYYNNLRKVKPVISGLDLIEMGLKPGIRFKQIIETIQDAKLNGLVHSKEEELRLTRNIIDSLPPE